ncbi:hypothetical protein [Embleya sp. NBC_00896]|uniref:hypothetical protein n=1 Tax=Embleya sp. NBC_00896 TaxID=2975961 RepID=UPI00386F612D|nr:hypothetical protein OG928_17970 [Embleya sp. NBC_00896]
MNPIATVVSVVAAAIAVIIVLHIVLFVFEANPTNGAVETIADWAEWLTRWAKDLFTPDNVKARVAANFGLAAVVYLAAGALISRLVGRV